MAVVKDYYSRIGRGDLAGAWALRWPSPRGDEAAFIAAYARYDRHEATVGAPSRVASSAGHDYVEVPVHLYGTMKDGKVFSSAGTVSLRRKAGGAWRIYPN